MNLIRPALVAVAVILLAGCLRPYRMDIQQGNVVTPDMLAEVRPGMTRRDVRYALGTPLVVDPFHTDRWDYVFRYQKRRSDEPMSQRVTLVFEGDLLARIEGDGIAADGTVVDPAALPAGTVATTDPDAIERAIKRKNRHARKSARENERRENREARQLAKAEKEAEEEARERAELAEKQAREQAERTAAASSDSAAATE